MRNSDIQEAKFLLPFFGLTLRDLGPGLGLGLVNLKHTRKLGKNRIAIGKKKRDKQIRDQCVSVYECLSIFSFNDKYNVFLDYVMWLNI